MGICSGRLFSPCKSHIVAKTLTTVVQKKSVQYTHDRGANLGHCNVFKRIFGYFGGETYQARAFRGSALMVVRLGGQNVLRLASNLILTRLLFPEAFGLMTLVTVVLVGVTMFSDLGINGSILQHKRGHDPVFLNTAWTVQILRGVVLCGAILLLAEPLANFYDTPLLADLLYVSALVPLMQGFNSTTLATARREIQFERLVALELFSQFIGILAMIALAWWLETVWALVIGTLVAPFLVALLSHAAMPGHKNWFAFERAALGDLFSFGRFVFIATLAGFFSQQGDRAVLGKFVSLDDLAIFNIGFFLATVPLLLAHAITGNVIYPLYARRPPAESENNRRKINKARFLLNGGLIAVTGLAALLGDWLIRVLYDPRYEAAGVIMVLVALACLPQLITRSYEKVPLANGHSGRFAIYAAVRAILLMGVLVLTIPQYGIVAAALAPAAMTVLLYPVLLWSIAPYKAWDPKHDLFYGVVTVAIILVVYWVHSDLIQAAMARPAAA